MNSVKANWKIPRTNAAPARSLTEYLVSYFNESEIRYHFVQRHPSKIELGMWGISTHQWFEESEKALRLVQAKTHTRTTKHASKSIVSNKLAQTG